MISRRTLLGGITLSLAGGALVGTRPAGASPVTVDEIGDRVQTVPRGALPDFAEVANPRVRSAYQYARDRPGDLGFIPCYCGCAGAGHRSNHDCYVKARHADGSVTFTNHGAT